MSTEERGEVGSYNEILHLGPEKFSLKGLPHGTIPIVPPSTGNWTKGLPPTRKYFSPEKEMASTKYPCDEIAFREDIIQPVKKEGDPEKKKRARFYGHPSDALNDPCRHSFNAPSQSSQSMLSNDILFLIHNLLTPEECKYLIEFTTPLMQPLDKHFAQSTRISNRIMIMSPSISDELYHRVRRFLTPKDYQGRIPLCFGQSGVWAPLCLNDCLKFMRYDVGGHFSVHRDGPWIPRADQASIFTVLVYLNDDFLGGETAFIPTEPGSAGLEGQRAASAMTFNIVRPVRGSCAVFNHDFYHGGEPVKKGTKYILRMEMIFQRVHSFFVDKFYFASSEEYKEVRALYDESSASLERGDREQFFEKYQKVVAKQLEASEHDREYMNSLPRVLPKLVPDVFGLMMEFLTDSEIVNLMLVSQGTFLAVAGSPVWYFKSQRRFGERFSTVSEKILRPKNLDEITTAEVARKIPSHPAAIDWYQQYICEVTKEREFNPVVVCPWVECSFVVASCRAPLDPFKYPNSDRLGPGALPTPSTLELAGATFHVQQCPTVFGHWEYAYPLHMNTPSWEEYSFSFNIEGVGRPRSITDCATGTVEWSVFTVVLDHIVELIWSPLAVVCHPGFSFSDEAVSLMKRDIFHLTRAPAVFLLHPALCLVAKHIYDKGDDAFKEWEPSPEATGRCFVAIIEGVMHYSFVVHLGTLSLLENTPNGTRDPGDVDIVCDATNPEGMSDLLQGAVLLSQSSVFRQSCDFRF